MAADLFDLAHHALGRPDGIHVKPYRNYFATDAGSAEAQAFAESPFWMRNGKESPGGLAYFHVTDAGIAAVWKWLREKQEAKGLRAYTVRVWWDELESPSERHVVAKSRGAAKYSAFLSSSDTWPELTFRRFCAFRIQVLVR